MGGAYTAMANDFSAIYWNPAGLASIPGGGVFTEGGRNILSNNVNYLGRMTTATDENNFLSAMGLVAAVPTVRGSFVIAVGINRIASYDNYLNFSAWVSHLLKTNRRSFIHSVRAHFAQKRYAMWEVLIKSLLEWVWHSLQEPQPDSLYHLLAPRKNTDFFSHKRIQKKTFKPTQLTLTTIKSLRSFHWKGPQYRSKGAF